MMDLTKVEKKREKKTGLTIAGRKAIAGRLFILPWFIGLIYFFLVPFIQGLLYTFNKIEISKKGFKLSFVGLTNYFKAFTDTEYVQKLTASLQQMIPQVLIIVFFSLFVAIVLRSEFKGRTMARAIFFLPVIISSGVVISVLKENVMMGSGSEAKQAAYMFATPSFDIALAKLGLPVNVLNFFSSMINQLFDLTWKSGVQILLLLAAVNNIPKSSYEVADIEGATEWEKFWKITFPLVSPTLLVAVIYTIIDSFTDYGNTVMRMVSDQMQKGYYEYSSTIAYIYFVCVLVIIGIVGFFMSRHVFYMSD